MTGNLSLNLTVYLGVIAEPDDDFEKFDQQSLMWWLLLGASPVRLGHVVLRRAPRSAPATKDTSLGIGFNANDGEASSGVTSLAFGDNRFDPRSPGYPSRQQSTDSSSQPIPLPHDPSMAQSQKPTESHLRIRALRASFLRAYYCKPHYSE